MAKATLTGKPLATKKSKVDKVPLHLHLGSFLEQGVGVFAPRNFSMRRGAVVATFGYVCLQSVAYVAKHCSLWSQYGISVSAAMAKGLGTALPDKEGEKLRSPADGKKSPAARSAAIFLGFPPPCAPLRNGKKGVLIWELQTESAMASSSLPAITGQGVEDSTIAGNEAAVALLRSFLEHFLRANRALATVDDKNADEALVELPEDDEGSYSGGGGGVQARASSSSSSSNATPNLSLRELVRELRSSSVSRSDSDGVSLRELVQVFQGGEKALFTTRLFWGQLAYWLTFKSEKKNGEMYKHSTAKTYLNSMQRLVREECEITLVGDAQSKSKNFFDDAQKASSWFKKIQTKMERHFAQRAADEGESLVKKAQPVAHKQLTRALPNSTKEQLAGDRRFEIQQQQQHPYAVL